MYEQTKIEELKGVPEWELRKADEQIQETPVDVFEEEPEMDDFWKDLFDSI